ncbi:hypothetical protein [Microbacterium dauci]|uniref:HTH cro/C1-type domain-containing protein n=1 Tax=Microbacterium dauci TaxID=3048008 RepID=A0ABT6ZAM6_9MICO|nr:hypothetical protein [Microbacterium sp. LX3-4]MDJ1113204.1 hypothetical protein [Microbacterium sp. LX3-4]
MSPAEIVSIALLRADAQSDPTRPGWFARLLGDSADRILLPLVDERRAEHFALAETEVRGILQRFGGIAFDAADDDQCAGCAAVANSSLLELRAEMVRQRRTPADLAEVLGVSVATAIRRLDGVTPMNVADFGAACEWLQVAPHVLIARAEAAL